MTEDVQLVTIEVPILSIALFGMLLVAIASTACWVGFLQTWLKWKSKTGEYLEDGRLALGIVAVLLQIIIMLFLATAL